MMDLSLPVDSSSPSAARSALETQELPIPRGVLPDLQLLVSELVTNAVRHARMASDQRIEVRVRVEPDHVRVEVEDPGRGFTPMPRRPDDRRDAGWGLYLVDRLADRWGVFDGSPAVVWFEVGWAAGWSNPAT
jgi:anti-sigma regulatory factor (Ser/Thr protein kinase)